MLAAFLLALRQLGDPRVLRILAKSLAVTLGLFAVLGAAGWWLLVRLLAGVGAGQGWWSEADGLRGVLAFAIVVFAGWLLWRVLALAVLQLFADEVVEAVEARHYPAALASARPLGLAAEVRLGAKGALRAVAFNLLALPVALLLLVSGVGAALVFFAVNASLLGRELTDTVRLRHREAGGAAPAVGTLPRLALGGIVTAGLTLPVANLLAPVVGAAMATHLVHRGRATDHAP